jgi:inner membrane transporter RhtA
VTIRHKPGFERPGSERRGSAVLMLIGAATSVQAGASVAKSLFPELGPPGVVFLRLLFGAIALWAIARPELRGRPWHEL